MCVRLAEALPAQYVKEGLLCRAEYAYGEAGWTVDEAACYSKGLCLFSAIYSYDLNRCLRCVCQGTRHEDLEYTLR